MSEPTVNILEVRSWARVDGELTLGARLTAGVNWKPSDGVPFITTPADNSSIATGKVTNDSSGSNLFQLMTFIANPGTAPSIAFGSFTVGQQVWAENLLAGALGNNAAAIGTEIDIGAYPSRGFADTDGTNVLKNVIIDPARPASKFEIGNTITGTNIPGGTTITAVSPNAWAPTTITLSAATTGNVTQTSIVSNSTGQTGVGVLVVGEGGNIGGPGNDGFAAIQVQGNTNSGFGTGLRISSTGLAAGASTGILFAAVAPGATGKGMYFNACTFGSGIEFANGTYTRGIFLNGITATTGLDFTGSALTQAIKFGAGHHIAFDTTTGTKIGLTTSDKFGFWGTAGIAKPAAITGSRGANAALADLLTKLASTGLITDSTTA